MYREYTEFIIYICDWESNECLKKFVGKSQQKTSLWKPSYRWKSSIKNASCWLWMFEVDFTASGEGKVIYCSEYGDRLYFMNTENLLTSPVIIILVEDIALCCNNNN